MIKLSLQSLSYRDTFNSGEIDLVGIIEKAAEYRLDGIDVGGLGINQPRPGRLEGCAGIRWRARPPAHRR